ncbi:MAG: hypothetical protein ACJAX4_003688 [Clostridium sp.]|jgi:hypothetical protein
MKIVLTIFIDDKINNIHEEIAGTHQFHQPQEKPKEDPVEPTYKTLNHFQKEKIYYQNRIISIIIY